MPCLLATQSLVACRSSFADARRLGRPTLLLAALRAVAGLGLGLGTLGLVGCNSNETPVFDPRTLEMTERQRAMQEPRTRLDQFPGTLQPTPTPKGGSGGVRPATQAYLTTLPTTGRNYTAENTVTLSLRDVITRAVMYSAEVRVAGFDPAINSYRVIEQESAYDIAAFLNLRTERQDSGLSTAPNIQGNTVVGFTDKTITNTSEIGLQQKLATGGQARLTYGLSWNRIDNLTANDQRFWQNQLRLEITQPLLRDYGRDVNSARIEIARGDQRISVLDFRKTIEEQLSELERGYWQLSQSIRVVQIQENVLADTIETYRVLYERWIKGLDASEIPVSQAQSSVKQRQADLIRAKQSVLDLSDEIKRRMNDPQFPVSSQIVIVPSDEPLRDPVNFDLKTMIDTAAVNRFELAQQLIKIEQARVAEVVAKNNMLPRLDLVGSTSVRGLGRNASEAISRNDQFNTPSWNIGIEIEYPIENRAARSIFARARTQRQQAIEQYRSLLAQVSLDVKVSMNDIQSSWEQAIARQQARLASTRQLSLLQKQQDLGEAITPSFVQIKLQAQEELANNAREEVSAIANYNIAIQRLERAKGTLLRYNNVVMKEDPAQTYLKRAWVEEGLKK